MTSGEGMSDDRLKELVVVGGGSAGWMTAAALASLLSEQDVNITLVESEQIGTVGVGEATIPDMARFNKLLGIPEADFMKATDATFKLGIEFVNWGRIGERYFHPFGELGADMNGIDFHQFWMADRDNGSNLPIEAYSLCHLAAEQDKFIHPSTKANSVLALMGYAYHFDATRYAAHLRDYSERRGVKRVEGIVETVGQDAETGDISSLTLQSGETVAGDFFFDCTGFRALLMRQTLEVPFVDWSHWLPCNAAQTVASELPGSLPSYTRATAHEAGWQWRIPTQSRLGNGHVYSTDFTDDETARERLLEHIDTPLLGEPRQLRFTTGHLDTFWQGNCIGIGLSSGFLEPLESTSLYLIQSGISKFISLYPTTRIPDVMRFEYNRQMKEEFAQIRDFLILHYRVTERDDSAFWNYVRTMEIPDSLTHKMELFREGGRIFRYENELFSKPSWVAVMLGQNMIPETTDPFVTGLPPGAVRRSLTSMRGAMERAVTQMPAHSDYLANFTAAAP